MPRGEDPDASGDPSNPRVLLGLAVGRLSVDTTGTGPLPPPALLADDLPSSTISDPKKARSHLKAIMKKGGHKLTPGKRLRLRNDEDGYDVHILCDRVDEGGLAPCVVVLFVLTVDNFSKYYSIATVLKDFRGAVYGQVEPATLAQMKAGSVAGNKAALQPAFTRLVAQYGQSSLLTAETKVAAVKELMTASVAKALNSVEHLEELEESSERFEEQSKQFSKRAVAVKKVHRRNYWWLGGLGALLIIAVLLYFIIPAAIGSKSSSSPVSSSSTGVPAVR